MMQNKEIDSERFQTQAKIENTLQKEISRLRDELIESNEKYLLKEAYVSKIESDMKGLDY